MGTTATPVTGFRMPSGAGRLCVPVIGTSPEQMWAHASALLPAFPFQELRLDYLATPLRGTDGLRGFIEGHKEATFLATCRPLRSGGLFHGSAQDEFSILQAAAQAGCSLVDLSLESAEELGPEALEQLRLPRAAVLLSFHDFEGTGDLDAILARMRPFHPDLYKIVPTAHSLDDSLGTLHLLRETDGKEPGALVAVAMGEAGLITRVLGPRSGSAFTFAAASEAEATAPGQLAAHTLTDVYRINQISPKTRLYGVAGDPIRSSLSPLMLNTAFRDRGIDAAYLPLKTADAEELFRVARSLPLDGFSVTMPLKQAILPLLDGVTPLAARIGAVNTVHRTADGKFHGDNTDTAGITTPLKCRLALRDSHVLVLGAGGAARAAVFGCADEGAQVFVYNRTAEHAEQLALEAGVTALQRSALAVQDFDVLINATPAGMRGNPLTQPIEDHELRAKLVFDLVYNPLETPLLALARAQGRETIPGVEMFVHQGARQFQIWTGSPAPVNAMQRAVLDELSRR